MAARFINLDRETPMFLPCDLREPMHVVKRRAHLDGRHCFPQQAIRVSIRHREPGRLLLDPMNGA